MIKNSVNKNIKENLKKIELENSLKGQISNLHRARSITVGTVCNGTSEILMRGDGEDFLYIILQPVEIIELINQLAANVGCHIAIKPREDFSSWREWKISEAEKKHLNGFPPFVNDMAVFQRLGMAGFNQEEAENLMNNWLKVKQYIYPEEEKTQNIALSSSANDDKKASKQLSKTNRKNKMQKKEYQTGEQ